MSLNPDLYTVLEAYPGLTRKAAVERLPGGLVNDTFSVSEAGVEYVLQRISAKLRPEIHENISAVTQHLTRKGVVTPVLIPTRDGRSHVNLGRKSCWRLLSRMQGVAFDRCESPEHARSAAVRVAEFHSALVDLEYDFEPIGPTFHDLPRHLADLDDAIQTGTGHPMQREMAVFAAELREAASDLEDLSALPLRAVHGDLKFSNILFGDGPTLRAHCLIDLDTLSRFPLAVELGDGWRSWCNRAGEGSAEAELDPELFQAAAESYLAAIKFDLTRAERASLVCALERMSLELSVRFAADALVESYFRWDSTRYASAAEHNRLRAKGQLSLYRQARETRDTRASIIFG